MPMPLTKRPTVVSNGHIDIVLNELEEYMNRTPEWANFNIEITSAVRTVYTQLVIIETYANKKGIRFAEFVSGDPDAMVTIDRKKYYAWQRTWSKLLNVGIIINPCYDAECLHDYIVNGVNKKGSIIKQSTHMQGSAFDISGNAGLDNLKRLIEGAMKDKIGISSFLVERKNNALHCNINI